MQSINEQNRLSNEKSPYLLQHANNPVDWYPWGTEAFEKAKAEDKPVLLSIGYSACHWCHTMAEESFSDKKTAEIINKFFVPVKVDREERPDIDNIYMNVCQALTGSGGWPLNLLLTPSKKPFFAGTYYPREDTKNIPGFKTLLNNAAQAWSQSRQEVVDTASKISDFLNKQEGLYTENISDEAVSKCVSTLEENYDEKYGGFGPAPKFPMPQMLMFLLRYGKKYSNAKARGMAEKTLQKIYNGGIHDHVGGGFFRYSTDEKWLVPHFEKMLYDNALLAMTFLEAGGNFKKYANETFDFLVSDMQSKEGGFYSAISATTSEGEGSYYVWSKKEIKEALGKDADDFCEAYGIIERGTFKSKSIPHIKKEKAKDFTEQLDTLYGKRLQRVSPDIDKKILTGWNALCAAAFARGYKIEKEEQYLKIAKQVITFIDEKLRNKNGRLLARYYDNDANIYAYADDYAYLMWAFIELYEATEDASYLKRAQETWLDVLNYFWDEKGGAYFYANDAERLIARPMEGYDMSTPSANSVLAYSLSKLYDITKDENYKSDMNKIFYAFGELVNEYPTGFCFMLNAKMNSEK